MNDFMKIVKSLEEFGLLIKGASETVKNEAKKQRRGFLGMLLDTLGASLLSNLLTGKRRNKGTILIPSHPLTKFEIQNIIKMNLNLMVFIQETAWLK